METSGEPDSAHGLWFADSWFIQMMRLKNSPLLPRQGQGVCLSGLTQIQFYLTSWSLNACELRDPLILNHCSLCLYDFTSTFGWLPGINKSGFKEVGAPLSPLRHPEAAEPGSPLFTLPAMRTVGSLRSLHLGRVLVLHVCGWLCPASVTGATCGRGCPERTPPAGRRREGLVPTLLSAFAAPRLPQPWPVGMR